MRCVTTREMSAQFAPSYRHSGRYAATVMLAAAAATATNIGSMMMLTWISTFQASATGQLIPRTCKVTAHTLYENHAIIILR